MANEPVKTPDLTKEELLASLRQLKGLETIQDAVAELVRGRRIGTMPQESLVSEIIRQYNEPFKTIDYDTTVARNYPDKFDIQGGVLQIMRVTGNDLTSYVDIQFNSPQNSPVRLYLGDRIITPFSTFYISNPAQAGVIFTIGVGLEFENIFQFDKNLSSNIGTLTEISRIIGLTTINNLATIVSSEGYSADTGVSQVTLYTVPANVTLYIHNACALEMTTNSSNITKIVTRTGAGVLHRVLTYAIGVDDNAGGISVSGSGNFLPPIPVPAGYTVRMEKYLTNGNSLTTNGWSYASINAYEI